MAGKYIHELVGWPTFSWDAKTLAPVLSGVRLNQGLLLGKLRGYGFTSRWTATLNVLSGMLPCCGARRKPRYSPTARAAETGVCGSNQLPRADCFAAKTAGTASRQRCS